jgi:hypothetical protein
VAHLPDVGFVPRHSEPKREPRKSASFLPKLPRRQKADSVRFHELAGEPRQKSLLADEAQSVLGSPLDHAGQDGLAHVFRQAVFGLAQALQEAPSRPLLEPG